MMKQVNLIIIFLLFSSFKMRIYLIETDDDVEDDGSDYIDSDHHEYDGYIDYNKGIL